MTSRDQQLNVSVWIPLGINNLLALKERIESYLKKNREKLRFTSWNGEVQLRDPYLEFILCFNSPYDKYRPITLVLEARYYGWGYVRVRLTVDEEIANDETQTLPPNFVNDNMRFLLDKSVDIIAGTLLDHQRNYFANVLFGHGIIKAEKYMEVALKNHLENGIWSTASDDQIRQGFRFAADPNSLGSVDTVEQRNHDLLVKTFVLKHHDSLLSPPAAYDDFDGDFNNFREKCETQYLRGNHRSSLLIWKTDLTPLDEQIIDQICSHNALIRFLRRVLATLGSVREQLAIVRMVLLQERGIKFAKEEIPKIFYEVERDGHTQKVKKDDRIQHVQGYVLYLRSRIPLLEELTQYLLEARKKVKSLPFEEKALKEIQSWENAQEFDQTKAYMDDLVETAARVQHGLQDEIESIKDLIEIHDVEESLDVSKDMKKVLDKIQFIQSQIQQLALTQTTMQKRAVESQFIQSEFARSSELRQRVARRTTQAAVAATAAGLLNNASKDFFISFLNIQTNSTEEILLNAILLLIWFTVVWFAVGNIFSQTRKFGDIVEVIVPLDPEPFKEKDLLENRFKDEQKHIPKKRFHRFRVEANMYRITWEDEVQVKVSAKGFVKFLRRIRPNNPADATASRTAFATLEYFIDGEQATLSSLMMSVEKSQVQDETLEQLQDALLKLASERLHTLYDKYSETDWRKKIEAKLTSINEVQIH